MARDFDPDEVHQCEGWDDFEGCPDPFNPVDHIALDMGPIIPRARYMCYDCHTEWKIQQLTAEHLTDI